MVCPYFILPEGCKPCLFYLRNLLYLIVVRMIYDSFLAGHSVHMIKAELEAQGVPATKGGAAWSESVIRSILKNEKYCGDVLMQKTFTQDCITKKQLSNRGQLPMYLKRNNHEGIVSRDTYNAVRAELVSLPGGYLSVASIDRRLDELNQEFQSPFKRTSGADYLSHTEEFKRISDEMSALKEKRALLLERQNSDSAVNRRIQDAVDILNSGSPEITEWDESMIRQLVDTVTVLSANKIRVYFRGGMESEQVLKDIR